MKMPSAHSHCCLSAASVMLRNAAILGSSISSISMTIVSEHNAAFLGLLEHLLARNEVNLQTPVALAV